MHLLARAASPLPQAGEEHLLDENLSTVSVAGIRRAKAMAEAVLTDSEALCHVLANCVLANQRVHVCHYSTPQ